MEQLSRPYQIALGAILVLALAWFLVLKPGDDEPLEPAPTPAASAPASPTAPGVEGLGRAVDQANGAAAQSDASAQATQDAAAAASGEAPAAPASSSSAPVPATPASGTPPSGGEGLEPGDASRPILADVASGKVAVVLFYNAKGADDRAVRRALKGVDRFKGRVRVRQVPIERVADYPAITQGAPVTQAPTLLVIDTQKRARRLVGYQDTRTIQQLVGDVGGAGFLGSAVARYRERILTMCERFDIGTDATIVATTGDLDSVFSGIRAEALDVLRTVRALDPPRGFSAFQSSYIQQLEEAATVFDRAARAERRNRTGRRKLSSEFAGPDPEGERFDRLARARGLQACF